MGRRAHFLGAGHGQGCPSPVRPGMGCPGQSEARPLIFRDLPWKSGAPALFLEASAGRWPMAGQPCPSMSQTQDFGGFAQDFCWFSAQPANQQAPCPSQPDLPRFLQISARFALFSSSGVHRWRATIGAFAKGISMQIGLAKVLSKVGLPQQPINTPCRPPYGVDPSQGSHAKERSKGQGWASARGVSWGRLQAFATATLGAGRKGSAKLRFECFHRVFGVFPWGVVRQEVLFLCAR